jgi:Carboxypeptidase regulatory-like domain
MGFSVRIKRSMQVMSLLLVPLWAAFAGTPAVEPHLVVEKNTTLGIIKGVVRDDGGSPIAEATVAIFRAGTSKLLKQVTSSSDGSFLTRILPGTYTVLAVAQGFNPMYLFGVEVGGAAELNYGFKLERAGSGATLPEKRLDRNSSKWRIRAAQTQRSIYQHDEGNTPIEDQTASVVDEGDERTSNRKGQTVVESYFAGSSGNAFAGVNAATLLPVGDDAEVVLAGQTGTGTRSPQRFEADLKLRPAANHQLRFSSSVGFLGNIQTSTKEKPLGQVSFQGLDEWKIREGVIFVFGLDYSRFAGAGDDFSLSPRLGFQYDLNAKTRIQTALTTQTEEKSWAHSVDLEGETVSFAEPVSVEDFVFVGSKPKMNKSRRIEFGVERVIDDRSSVEANAFFDTTFGRGVGLNSFAFDSLDGQELGDLVANQQGRTQGVRVVYTRRLNDIFTATVGYSAGSGQKLSAAAITDPAHVFESDFFQSFFGQLAADLKTGTSMKTVFRLSPEATIFAIDPFKGRLAIYDPGLSIMITQSLPSFGLPLRAEAILDGRNLFDFQSGVSGDEGSVKLSNQGRMLRGGIQVRF